MEKNIFAEKNALIIGGTKGTGLEIARLLLQKGAKVGVKEKNAAENYFFPKNLLLWQTLLPEQKLLKAEKSL